VLDRSCGKYDTDSDYGVGTRQAFFIQAPS
jgi:hypothetical protein